MGDATGHAPETKAIELAEVEVAVCDQLQLINAATAIEANAEALTRSEFGASKAGHDLASPTDGERGAIGYGFREGEAEHVALAFLCCDWALNGDRGFSSSCLGLHPLGEEPANGELAAVLPGAALHEPGEGSFGIAEQVDAVLERRLGRHE